MVWNWKATALDRREDVPGEPCILTHSIWQKSYGSSKMRTGEKYQQQAAAAAAQKADLLRLRKDTQKEKCSESSSRKRAKVLLTTVRGVPISLRKTRSKLLTKSTHLTPVARRATKMHVNYGTGQFDGCIKPAHLRLHQVDATIYVGTPSEWCKD